MYYMSFWRCMLSFIPRYSQCTAATAQDLSSSNSLGVRYDRKHDPSYGLVGHAHAKLVSSAQSRPAKKAAQPKHPETEHMTNRNKQRATSERALPRRHIAMHTALRDGLGTPRETMIASKPREAVAVPGSAASGVRFVSVPGGELADVFPPQKSNGGCMKASASGVVLSPSTYPSNSSCNASLNSDAADLFPSQWRRVGWGGSGCVGGEGGRARARTASTQAPEKKPQVVNGDGRRRR